METTPPSSDYSPEQLKEKYIARFIKAAENLGAIPDDLLLQAKATLANRIHNRWREDYIANPDNWDGESLKPNWKPTSDEVWITNFSNPDNPQHRFYKSERKGDGQTVHFVNIAGLEASDLPKNRREEVEQAAEFAVGQLQDDLKERGKGNVATESYLEGSAAMVHKAWDKRNPGKERDYLDLGEMDRNRDREHMVLAAELFARIGN